MWLFGWAVHDEDKAFVTGGQQATILCLVLAELCQRLVPSAEDGAMLIALFFSDQMISL
ncbi:hypothetical protein [Pseudomonas sp. NPDC089758]|uniref:hypothetical protein n=1 Tax=Pseudomonas sp. NPDC089758 TaxID=3364473 RepID=UPI003800CBB4